MPRTIAEISRELNDNLNASRVTTALMPANVARGLALAVELAEASAVLESRVEALEAKPEPEQVPSPAPMPEVTMG